MPVHPLAAEGFGGFETTASYERGRTGQPPEAVDHVVDVLGLRPGVVLAEVGAGTGKLSRLLAPSGAAVIAVEPVEAMRRVFREQSDLALVAGAAEEMPFAPRSLDAVTVAHTSHVFWCRRR